MRIRSDEMAKRLGLTKQTVQVWAREGKIPARKQGQEWFFNPAQVERHLNLACGNSVEQKIERGVFR